MGKGLRVTALVVALFFSWTLAGGASAAHAAKLATQQTAATPAPPKRTDAGEKFSQSVANVETLLADESLPLAAKQREVKARQAELVTLAAELRSEFAVTAKKLKAAKLAPEIQERQQRFVDRFEENLDSLKAELTAIESAKDEVASRDAIAKAREHLTRSKAPSRHQPLDPNKLPHRSAEPTKQSPRLKKEEFERAYGKDLAALPRPVRVAAAGALTNIIPANNDAPVNLGLPSLDDLAGTVDAPYSPAIVAKAAELGHDPLKIYNWVRNTIEFVPTWGSIQGAQLTMESKQGNAFDTASLLIALLRASGIHARYVTGTIELPIDKVMNWVGGFTDPLAALNFIASGGIPVTGLNSGGKIVAVRLEHVWVKAFVDYVPSLGAVHNEGDTWIPLDASFKKYNYTDGVDFKALVPFDGQGFAAQLKASSTVNEQEGSVTNVSSSMVQTALSDYNARLESYVSQNLPNATAADILGKKEIVRKEQAILPASLPYKVFVAGTEIVEISTQYRHKIGIKVVAPFSNDGTAAISYSASLPQLAGKRVTVSFDPATPADKAVIDNYAEQYATTLPAYLIQVVPTLRIDNAIIASGPPIGMGNEQRLSISISSPEHTEIVTHNLTAGDYTAIGINPSKISLDVLQNRIDKNDFSEPVGEMLCQTALSYWAEADAFNDVIAKTLRVRNLRHPSELAATAKVSVSSVFGVPTYATYKSRNLDVKLDNQTVMGMAVDKAKEIAYMQQSGANSSFLEGAIFDQLFGKNIGDSISAVSAMKLANDQGIPIYGIDANNVAATLPKLQVAQEIKDEVANAVNAGLTVQIPKTNVTQFGWTGVGYIISNHLDGTGAYRISGGLNGGESGAGVDTVVPVPQIPIHAPALFVIGGIMSSSGLALTAEGGVITGIAISPGAAAALVAGAEIVGLILLLILVFSIAYSVTSSLIDQ